MNNDDIGENCLHIGMRQASANYPRRRKCQLVDPRHANGAEDVTLDVLLYHLNTPNYTQVLRKPLTFQLDVEIIVLKYSKILVL
jgi:hypothetical protein